MYHSQMAFQPFATSREMTVIGNGEIMAQPDYAQIQIGVRTEGKDVSAVQQENAVIMNRVVRSLEELNIPKEAIQTTTYSIFPNYDYIEGKQVFRSYSVQNTITVKITDVRQAGIVIDTAIQNGANHVSAIQFEIENVDKYYRQALQLALVDAQAKAQSMAETMHLILQPVPFDIVEEMNTSPIPFRSVELSNQQPVTPIEPGMITVSATVRVKFRY